MIKISISPGNTKTGRIPAISSMPVRDCINCGACKADCYALKAVKQYKNTRNAWGNNGKLLRSDMSEYFRQLENWFTSKRKTPKFFRIHVAGDFISQDHVDKWCEFAAGHPATKFLAFTKSYHLMYEIKPDNLQVVFSVFPTTRIESNSIADDTGEYHEIPADVRLAWVNDGKESRIPDTAISCPGNCETCGMCWNLSNIGRDVYFDKH